MARTTAQIRREWNEEMLREQKRQHRHNRKSDCHCRYSRGTYIHDCDDSGFRENGFRAVDIDSECFSVSISGGRCYGSDKGQQDFFEIKGG